MPARISTSEQELLFQLTTELDKETDRALAIVSASYLDYLLVQLISIQFKLSKSKKTELFNHSGGMLHSFSSKITFAHLTGLINNDQKKDLDTIRGIRNEFAHKLIGISFITKKIVDASKNLILARVDGRPPTAKEQFKKSSVRLMVDLNLKINHLKESKK